MTKKIERIGFVQAMNGQELWVNTITDERITIVAKDRKVRWDFYCNYVKVTIEKLTEKEFKDQFEKQKLKEKKIDKSKNT